MNILDLTISLLKGVFKHLLIFIGLILSISLFWENNLLLIRYSMKHLSLLLLFSLVFFWYKNIYRTDDIIMSIILSIGFLIGEIIIVKNGAWSYTNIEYTGVPIWLFFAWCHTVIAIHRVANSIQMWLLMKTMKKDMENKNESELN